MAKKTRPGFNPELKVECAQLVLDQGYSVREAAEAMNIEKSTLDKWVRKLEAKHDDTLSLSTQKYPLIIGLNRKRKLTLSKLNNWLRLNVFIALVTALQVPEPSPPD